MIIRKQLNNLRYGINIALSDSLESVSISQVVNDRTVYDQAIKTIAALPSLARGYIYRMALKEVKRYQAHNTHLNPNAVDAVFAQ